MNNLKFNFTIFLLLILSIFSSESLRTSSARASGNTNDGNCHYKHPDKSEVRFDSVLDMGGLRRVKRQMQSGGQGLQATPVPIRMALVIDPSMPQAAAQNIVVPAMQFHQNTLQVKYPLQYPLGVTQTCTANVQPFSNSQANGALYCWQKCSNVTYCGSYQVPSQFYSPCSYCNGSYSTCVTTGGGSSIVPNADIIVFVISMYDTTCTSTSSVAAYGTHCQVDPITGRTTVATINVCPKTLAGNTSLNIYGLRHTVIHEMTHVLGFSSGMFSSYLMPNGTQLSTSPLVSVMNPWQTASGLLSKNTTYLVTPTVVATVRSYFNCSTLLGGELEDQGGPGTAYTHWEKRVFNNELMTGIYTDTAFMSNITLALLQDTGWYIVNFSNAENYTWAKGLGCMYATNSCMTWIMNQRAQGLSPYPFCDQMANKLNWVTSYTDIRTICDPIDMNTIRFCNMQFYSTGINPLYQYFNGSLDNMIAPNLNPLTYAGGITYSDYCPYFAQQTVTLTGTTSNFYLACNDPANGGVNNGYQYDLSMYGPGQVCIKQATPSLQYLSSSIVKAPYWGAGCYKVSCTASAVLVTICNTSYVCTAEMQTISWNISSGSYYNFGSFVCPLCSVACPNTSCPMSPAGYNVWPTMLNVSTANETQLLLNITNSAAALHKLFPFNTSAPNTCPAVVSTSAATTITTATTLITTTATPANSATNTLNQVVASTSGLAQGNFILFCSSPNNSCPPNSSCLFLAQPYCRCVYPYFGVAANGCNQPNLTSQVPLFVLLTIPATYITSLNTPFNQTIVQSILFDLLIDQILSPSSTYTSYVSTSAYTTSVSTSANLVTVLVTIQTSMPIVTSQPSLVTSVQTNITGVLSNWFASIGQSGNFGLFTANCSAVSVSVSSICSSVQCPSTYTYCFVIGQLYNCICNATVGYISVGYSGSNPLVENCVSTNSNSNSSSTVTAGPGVNCSTTALNTVRCVCATGYAGSPQTGCILTANAAGVALIGVSMTINASMPTYLAVTNSVNYWSFVLSMEQDLNAACSASSTSTASCVSGSIKTGSITSGSIKIGYTAAYTSATGQLPSLSQIHAAHATAVQSYYAQAGASNNGLCTFGSIIASCSVGLAASDSCSGNNVGCLENSLCVNTDLTTYECVCAPGYVQSNTLSNMPYIVVCEASNSAINIGILLAIVLPCTFGTMIIILITVILIRIEKKKTEKLANE